MTDTPTEAPATTEAPAKSKASMRWYVVHAYSQYENNVKKALKERIERAGLQDKFGEILVPTEEVMEIREGQKRMTERKFFPGYVLVQMEMNEDTWHLVKSTPKVMGFIGGTPNRPWIFSSSRRMVGSVSVWSVCRTMPGRWPDRNVW